MWTFDPLAAIVNSASQLNKGGILCFNNCDRLMVESGRPGSDVLLKNLIEARNNNLPGFEILSDLNYFRYVPDRVALKKISPVYSSDEIIENWFGGAPKLKSRMRSSDRGFDFRYEIPAIN